MENNPKRKTHTSSAVKKRYNDKTYAQYAISLRFDTDANLIDYIERRKAEGILPTAVVRELYEKSQK